MDFTVKFETCNDIFFSFEDGEYCPIEMCEEEPKCITGCISVNDKQIGYLNLYELYNDCNFYEMCDSVSGDCEAIAGAVCGKNGNVMKKYLPKESEFETIFVLDHISIDEEYRGKGIGSDVIKNLLHMLRYQFEAGSSIFLCASDYDAAKKYGFDSDEYKIGCARLINFYKRLGFTVVKDNVMVYYEN